MTMEIQKLTAALVRLAAAVENLNARPFVAQAETLLNSNNAGLKRSAPPSPQSDDGRHFDVVLVIDDGPRPYKNGGGDFYDATIEDGGESIRLGVSSSRFAAHTFSQGQRLVCVCSESGNPARDGRRQFWLSRIVTATGGATRTAAEVKPQPTKAATATLSMGAAFVDNDVPF